MAEISVIIPALNEEKALEEISLPSLAEQTYNDFSVVVVVDKDTTDRTKEVAESFSEDLDIKVVDQPLYKKGPGGARNYGLEVASLPNGGVGVFMDADVEASPNYLEVVDKIFSKYDIAGLGCSIYLDSPVSFYRFAYQLGNVATYASIKMDSPRIIGNLCAYRKSNLMEAGGWKEGRVTGEDCSTSARVAETGDILFESDIYGVASDRRLQAWGFRKSLTAFIKMFYKAMVEKEGVDMEREYEPVRL